jgi:hypothetical protein
MPIATDSGYLPDWLAALIGQGRMGANVPAGLFSDTAASPSPNVGLLSNNPLFTGVNTDAPAFQGGNAPNGPLPDPAATFSYMSPNPPWGGAGPSNSYPSMTMPQDPGPMNIGSSSFANMRPNVNGPGSDVPLPPRRPNDLTSFQATAPRDPQDINAPPPGRPNAHVIGTEASGAPEVTAQKASSPGLGDYLGKASDLIGGIYGAGGPGDALIALGLSNRTNGASIQALNSMNANRASQVNLALKKYDLATKQRRESSTYDYLVGKGADPAVAAAAVDNPELMKHLVQQNEGLDKWKATKDAYGNPIAYNENDPSKTMKIGGGAVGEDAGPGTANGLIHKDNAHLKGDEFLATVPPELANRVRRINQGLEPLPVGGGFGAAKAANMQIADLVRQAYPDQDATVFKSRENTQKSFSGAGKDAQTISAFNSAISHGGLLAKAAEALDNGNVALFNNFRQQWATRTGQPLGDKVAYFNSVIDEFSKEMTRAYRGTGGAEADIKRELADLSPTLAPSQLRAKMLAKLDLLQSRMDSVQENWHNGMRDPGRELPDFPVISPHSQQVLNDIRKGSPTAAPSPNVAAPSADPGKQPPPGAKQGPDGKFYVPDPNRPGKYLMWVP